MLILMHDYLQYLCATLSAESGATRKPSREKGKQAGEGGFGDLERSWGRQKSVRVVVVVVLSAMFRVSSRSSEMNERMRYDFFVGGD